MATQQYSVTPHPIETILTWVKSGEIAIPEIQHPFVWNAIKVRNPLDSLYNGYPVGYLIAWRNPTVKLKDGTSSAGCGDCWHWEEGGDGELPSITRKIETKSQTEKRYDDQGSN